MTGTVFGRYEIKSELGRGGMAIVYHAHDPRFNRDVAIKILPREFLFEQTFRARFVREAQSIAGLEHSAIVPVHDFGEEEGQPFLVMRFMPGGSLADRIQQCPFPLGEITPIMDRIGAALDFAHGKGVIHRDVKPANVLFDEAGDAYLSDFGIVKVAETTAQLTGSGIVGTPAYMAPEMMERGDLTHSIDVYALGVTLFQMLTGQLPYEAATPMGVLLAHVSKPIPDARDLRPDLPNSIQMIIERAMAKDPAERYQSAGDLAADLRAVAGGLAPEAAPAPSPPDTEYIPRQPAQPPTPVLPEPTPPGVPAMDAAGMPEAVWEAPPLRPAKRRRRAPNWLLIGGGVVGVGLLAAIIVGLIMLGVIRGGTGDGEMTPEAAAVEETEYPSGEAAESSGPTATPTDEPTPTLIPTPQPTPMGGGTGRIAFTSDRDGNYEIYVMEADGSNVQRLTDYPGTDREPAWSPDGRRIAFTSFVGLRGDNAEIHVMDADGSNLQQLTDRVTDDGDPIWSPDGAYIAFVSTGSGVYVMEANGSNARLLLNSAEFSPAWSPDGTRMVFVSGRSGDPEIYVMDTDGSNVQQLTDNSAMDDQPAWSPDGTRIAFVSERDDYGDPEIYVMQADGSNVQRLTDNPADDFDPAWSPDGTRIAFVSIRDGNDEIYVMDADGSNVQCLTNNPARDSSPAWQPPPMTDAPSPAPTPTVEPVVNPAFVLAEAGVTSNADWAPYTEEKNGVEMALVPAGCFMMGSEDGDSDEQPVHEVCFDEPFWIDVHEVTNEQYGATGCESKSSEPDQPRNCVIWADALVHCEERGARLPTEAEWEYAARGPDSLVYPWGNDFVADNVVYVGNSGGQTWEVGSKPGGVSWIGAYDLSGNVWEWVNDWYGSYESGQQKNPQGPETGTYRVLRGGSFYEDSTYYPRGAYRFETEPPSAGGYINGFRCALSYSP